MGKDLYENSALGPKKKSYEILGFHSIRYYVWRYSEELKETKVQLNCLFYSYFSFTLGIDFKPEMMRTFFRRISALVANGTCHLKMDWN
jgi:hypothetical protein